MRKKSHEFRIVKIFKHKDSINIIIFIINI